MRIFPRFGAWINKNNQEPLNAKSNRSHNVESMSVSEKDTNKAHFKANKVYYDRLTNRKIKIYYDTDELDKQDELWHEAEMKLPWYDAPPKVKVTTKNGVCHMHIEFTVGRSPDGVYFLLTHRATSPFFDDVKWRSLLETKSKKVLMEDGPREIAKLDQRLAWDFLWWSGTLPIHLILDENWKTHTAKYTKEKMIFMKVFEGSYKVEPIYVDQERLCKHMLPKSQEEYKKCSGGQGKVASRVTMDQYFQPYPLLNLPPFSWYIRKKTIKTTKTLLEVLQKFCAQIRRSSPARTRDQKHLMKQQT